MKRVRLPRKTKKAFKKLYKHRYGCDWLKCNNLMVEYIWFYSWISIQDRNKKLGN